MIEGVDFSAGGFPTVATLNANGKKFIFSYAVDDQGPGGRSLTKNVYQQYRANTIDVGFYWEGKAEWMLGGWDAGVAAAQNAQQNLIRLGAPLVMPIGFAHDIDPEPQHFAAIDQCLSGAASVIGWERVGAYGGWLLIDYLASGGNVKQFIQTIAWEYGRGLHPAATAYQYDTRDIPQNRFDGVPCDLMRALKPNYGQASLYEKGIPVPTPKPTPAPKPAPKPTVKYPKGLDAGVAARLFGSFRASNGVTVKYSEGDELSALWLASGSYAKITDVAIYNDSPTVARVYWTFSDGRVYWRPNDKEPITLLKAAA